MYASPNELPPLSPGERLRYGRHLVLPELGEVGQRRIRAARILLVGAGGLGSPVALYLTAAGVGTLGIVEGDRVELSNLQRQVLHGTGDVGRRKVDSAKDRLADLNPSVELALHDGFLTAKNALELVGAYDLVVDGADNFATRYLLNDACVLAQRPLVHGSVFRFEGQATVLCAKDGPCYRCLYPEPPPPSLVPSCAEGGVLGVVPGLVGLVQATEALKWVAGVGTPLVGRLLLVDALGPRFLTVGIERDPACPACGTRTIRSVGEIPESCGGHKAAMSPEVPELEPRELASRRARGDDLDLVDVREPEEWARSHIAGARLVPLATLPAVASSFDRSREVVLYCEIGIRSEEGARVLLSQGVHRVWNLTGGIVRWAEEVGEDLVT
ncbi:MAG TPA: molybdopterin-synthase adenylyltransferase MoeB [Anaeromyxobacter sp.]|nr:molybdopterin-synthase adenylyltransferase MoeB [Anaeromyxobacter sp.]